MRLGVFGGTFDPPHVGHLILAAEADHTLALDQVLWVITPDPPHKKGQKITPLQHRLEMLESAIAADPHFSLSRIEMERPGPHYVVDTMRLLRERYPTAELIYLMGGDSLFDLPTWNRPRLFLSLCNALGVMRRPDDALDLPALEKILPGVSAKVRFIEAPLLQIASHEIRQRVQERRAFRYYLPDAVYQIVQERQLYR